MTNWGKKFYTVIPVLCKLGQIFSSAVQFKNKISFNFVIFVATKKVGRGQEIFSPFSFIAVLDPGPISGIRDGYKLRIQDPG
jgi:hypothetical protein